MGFSTTRWSARPRKRWRCSQRRQNFEAERTQPPGEGNGVLDASRSDGPFPKERVKSRARRSFLHLGAAQASADRQKTEMRPLRRAPIAGSSDLKDQSAQI